MDVVGGMLISLFLPSEPDPPPPPPAPLSDAEYKAKQDDEKREYNEKMAKSCIIPLSLCPKGYQEVKVHMPTKKIGNMYYADETTEKKKYCWNDGAFCSLDPQVYGDEWGTEDESGRIEIKRRCRDGVPTGRLCDDIKLPLCGPNGPPEGSTMCKDPRRGYQSDYCDIGTVPDPKHAQECEAHQGKDESVCKQIRIEVDLQGNSPPRPGDLLVQEWSRRYYNQCEVVRYFKDGGAHVVMCKNTPDTWLIGGSTGTVTNKTRNVKYNVTKTFGTRGRCFYSSEGVCYAPPQKTILSMSNYRPNCEDLENTDDACFCMAKTAPKCGTTGFNLEVFSATRGSGYNLTKDQAINVCFEKGEILCSKEIVGKKRLCNYGWMRDAGLPGFVSRGGTGCGTKDEWMWKRSGNANAHCCKQLLTGSENDPPDIPKTCEDPLTKTYAKGTSCSPVLRKDENRPEADVCGEWWAVLDRTDDVDKEAINKYVHKYCTAHGKNYDCRCNQRAKDKVYLENRSDDIAVPDGCWFGPCKSDAYLRKSEDYCDNDIVNCVNKIDLEGNQVGGSISVENVKLINNCNLNRNDDNEPSQGDGGDTDKPSPDPPKIAVARLEKDVEKGTYVIPMDDAKEKGFEAGQTIAIGKGATREERVIIKLGSLILDRPLEFDHKAGEEITIAPTVSSAQGVLMERLIMILAAIASIIVIISVLEWVLGEKK